MVTATIDLIVMAQKATDDLYIRGILNREQADSRSVIINIVPPVFTLRINNAFCEQVDCEPIRKLFEENVLQKGYLVDSNVYDYYFVLDAMLTDGEQAGQLVSQFITGNLSLYSKNKELLWQKSTGTNQSVGSSREEAIKKAYNAYLKVLNLVHFREGLEAIY